MPRSSRKSRCCSGRARHASRTGRLAKAGGIRGTVVDDEGRPVEGVEVNLVVETDNIAEARDADHRRQRRLSRSRIRS